MAFCRYCGRPIEEGSRFCTSCGAKVEESAGAANPDPAAPMSEPEALNAEGYAAADVEKTKVICAVSYLSILFFLPLVAYPGSRFGKFHANQALLLLIVSTALKILVSAVAGIWWAIPFSSGIAHSVSGVFSLAEWSIPLAGAIYGIVNALNGRARELPIVGKINLINK
ncbi:MAG: zinc-ribbon domain-containing protein [Bacteroides sp.]|nr:zinc-ribbon domain-containing protein [Eubacterium sp.]MCM1419504.1 zinc-ribbon domain-containing protein [Roseburia sp.]MCM1463271.1 zinc-ribbon domain-containing protein [Bacteroides sp.]